MEINKDSQVTPEEKVEETPTPTGDESVEKKEEVVEPVQPKQDEGKSPEEIARLQSIADKALSEKRENVDYWNKQADLEKDPSKKLEAQRKAFEAEKSLFEMQKDIPQGPSLDQEVDNFKAEMKIEAGTELDQIFTKAKAMGGDDYKEIATYTMTVLRAALSQNTDEGAVETPVKPVDLSKGPAGTPEEGETVKRGDIFSTDADTKKAAKEKLMNTIKTLANKGGQ